MDSSPVTEICHPFLISRVKILEGIVGIKSQVFGKVGVVKGPEPAILDREMYNFGIFFRLNDGLVYSEKRTISVSPEETRIF